MGTQNLTLNFNEICRLCLVKEGEMSSIFAVSLPKRIMSFVSFEIYEGDGLPTLICQQCCHEVDRSYKFKMICETSDATLKQCVGKSNDDNSEDEGVGENSGIKEESDYEEGNKDIFVKPENDDEDSCDDKHDTLKDVSYEDDDDDSCDNTDIPSLKVNREGYNEVVDGNVENQVPIVREERAGTSNSENIVILCNVETLPQRFAALQEPFGNDSSHKDDKKRRRRNNIQKPNRKTRLRRIPKNKKPTPALKSQSSQSLLICVKSEPKLIEEDDDILSEDKPPFICKICSKSFSKRDNLKKHEIIHRGEKPYLCEECGKSFARKQDLNVHRRYHSGVRPYACSLCDKTFHSYSGLKSHENRHNGIKPFLCNACGKTFVQKSQLTNHERVHTQEKPYACTLCEKTFTTLTNLKTHQKRHTGINDFACSTCGKSFFTKSGLERHELLHTGHKAFACELCDLSFFTKSEITRHMRYHKGEKRFTCTQCNKSFIENQHLIIHERIHTGERPYLCQLCKKSFYTKSKLNRHMRTHAHRS